MDERNELAEVVVKAAMLKKERDKYREALITILRTLDPDDCNCDKVDAIAHLALLRNVNPSHASDEKVAATAKEVTREELVEAIRLIVRRCPTMHEAESHLADALLKTYRVERRK